MSILGGDDLRVFDRDGGSGGDKSGNGDLTTKASVKEGAKVYKIIQFRDLRKVSFWIKKFLREDLSV